MLETNEAKLECEVVTCADSTRIRACFALISSCKMIMVQGCQDSYGSRLLIADCEHPAPIDNANINYYKMKSTRNTLGYEYYQRKSRPRIPT